jgi:Fe-S oxidoreductase
VIIFLTILHQQAMAPDTLPPGTIGTESRRTTGASRNAPLGETQQQRRHQLVHRDAAIVATENMTQDTHLKKVRKTGSSKNKKQHAIGCESIHIHVNDSQLKIKCTVGVRKELRDQLIASRNGKSLWSTKGFVRTVRKIDHHDGVSSWIFADKFRDKRPQEWTKQALKTLEEATESYMVEVIPGSHCTSSN